MADPGKILEGAPSNDRCVSCLAPPLRSGAKQLEAFPRSRGVRGVIRASLVPPLRSGTKLALACRGTSSHRPVPGGRIGAVAAEEKLHTDMQHIGSAANPANRADETANSAVSAAHWHQRWPFRSEEA
jgi:hypothetical protein